MDERLFELIHKRRSVRTFSPKPVAKELLERLVEAAIWAPSSCNRQPIFIIYSTDTSQKQKLASAAYNQKHLIEAPVLMVLCIDMSVYKGSARNNLAPILDAGVALQNFLLAAESLGLSACPCAGKLNEPVIRAALGIPSQYRVAAFVAIGYATAPPPPPPQRGRFNEYYSIGVFSKGDLTKYREICLKRQRLSRLGGDVSYAYQSPAEGIELFRYVRDRIGKRARGYDDVLLTYSGMGYFLKSMPLNVSCLSPSEDEIWFLKEFQGVQHKLIKASALELNRLPTSYDWIVSLFDAHFMDDQEFDQFLSGAQQALKPGGQLTLVFFNRVSLYGLNFLIGKIARKVKDVRHRHGFERPISKRAILDRIGLQDGLKISSIETGQFVPVPNFGYFGLPSCILGFFRRTFPYEIYGFWDKLASVPVIRNLGNVAFMTTERREN